MKEIFEVTHNAENPQELSGFYVPDLNLYVFSANSPVQFIDVKGEAVWVPIIIIGCKIAHKGYKVYQSVKKGRKALGATCTAIHAAYSVACKLGCKGKCCCELTQGVRNMNNCVNGRKLYINSGCDRVGRGYGAKGKTNPHWQADKAKHEGQLRTAQQGLQNCISKKNRACALEPSVGGSCSQCVPLL
jgi:hypothetical protein